MFDLCVFTIKCHSTNIVLPSQGKGSESESYSSKGGKGGKGSESESYSSKGGKGGKGKGSRRL
jgi:hypothetical protein